MRIVRLEAPSFGALSGRTLDLDGSVVVVEGPNESGKSTFRGALETVLYGFDPANREQHPLTAGGARDLELLAELEHEGRRERVERVLQQRGKLRLAAPAEDFAGPRQPNRPLGLAGDVPLALFRSVYALSTDDLVALDERAREHAGELLLGERALPELLPVHQVRAALAAEASRLWRSDRRGKARHRELREALGQARAARARAREEEEQLRAVRVEGQRLARQLEGLREQRDELERERDEAALLRELAELERRQGAVGPLDLAPLGGRPLVPPLELRSELDLLERRLNGPARRLAAPPRGLSPRQRALLEQASRIEAAQREEGRHLAELEALAAARGEVEALRSELRRAWDSLGGDPAAGDVPEHLTRLPLTALRATHRTWSEAFERAHAVPRGRALEPALLLAAILGGTLSLVAGLGDGSIAAHWGVAGTLVVLAALLVALRAPAARGPEPRAEREAMLRALAELGLDAGPAPGPLGVQTLLDGLARAREVCERLEQRQTAAQRLEGAIRGRERSWRELARAVGIDAREAAGPAEPLLEALGDELALARVAEEEVREERLARERDARQVQELEQRRLEVSEHLERVLEVIERCLPAGLDEEDAWHELLERREEHAYLRQRRRELERDPRTAALRGDPRLQPRRGERAPWSPRACEEREQELRRVGEEIEARSRRAGEIAAELARDPGGRVARAEERARALEEELRSVQVRRDRLALLDGVLNEAERRFRERHQPDVLRRAGELLAEVTAGRYTRLDAVEDGRRLEVWPGDGGDPLPAAPPLSRGTLDQVFLCLRLGLLDHLDAGRTPLPWVLDEVLVHWDEGRRRALYPLLARAARRRQVFLLTCHPALAREAREALDARHVVLPAPSGARVYEDREAPVGEAW